jgi:hypothetical protein
MDKVELNRLNFDELVLMKKLSDILALEEFEFSIINNTYTNIKFNGCACLSDVLQLEALSIPLFELIELEKSEPVSIILDRLNNHSINFYEIRMALDMFVTSSWN